MFKQKSSYFIVIENYCWTQKSTHSVKTTLILFGSFRIICFVLNSYTSTIMKENILPLRNTSAKTKSKENDKGIIKRLLTYLK